jgi:hypothetical protein
LTWLPVLHFGNVLAARVTNPDLRSEVLADMARALAAVPHDGVFNEPALAEVPVEQNGASGAGFRVPPATTRGQA